MAPTRKRLLTIGAAVSVVVIAVSVGLSILTGGSLPWQGVAIMLLALAALLFVSRMVVISGSGMSMGIGDPHEVYIEAMARSASEHGLTGHTPSTYQPAWLWAALPPLVALVVIVIVG